jgi:hypothetical protein
MEKPATKPLRRWLKFWNIQRSLKKGNNKELFYVVGK